MGNRQFGHGGRQTSGSDATTEAICQVQQSTIPHLSPGRLLQRTDTGMKPTHPTSDDRRGANRQRSMHEYATGQVKLTSRPRALFLELTQGCNLRCPMCRSELIPPSERLMPRRLFDRIAEELFPTAELVDLRGWGESVILPDFISYVEAVRSAGSNLRIVTNLSYHRDAALDALVAANATIDVSLDASTSALLDVVRTGSRLPLIEANISRIIGGFGHADNLTLLVTIQRATIEALPDLVTYAANLGVRRIRLASVTADDASELAIATQTAALTRALSEATGVALARGMDLVAATQLGSLPTNPTNLPPCIHPWAYCYVAYDGQVGFCDHLIGPGNAEYFVGNLNDEDFDAVWNGERMMAMRSEHLGRRRREAAQFAHCAWCYKSKYIDFEQIFDPSLERQIVRLT